MQNQETHLTKAARASFAAGALAKLAHSLDVMQDCIDDQDILDLAGWSPFERSGVWTAIKMLTDVAHAAIVDAGRAVGWDAESGEPLERTFGAQASATERH